MRVAAVAELQGSERLPIAIWLKVRSRRADILWAGNTQYEEPLCFLARVAELSLKEGLDANATESSHVARCPLCWVVPLAHGSLSFIFIGLA